MEQNWYAEGQTLQLGWEAETCRGPHSLRQPCRARAKRWAARFAALQGRETQDEAERWIGENQFLIAMALRDSAAECRNARLPVLDADPETPRILALAREMRRRAIPLERTALTDFLTGFQRTVPLRGVELRFLLPALQICLLEELEAQTDSVQEAIQGLRQLGDLDCAKIGETVSPIHVVYAQEPSGVYLQMTQRGRAAYRLRTERLARREDCTEPEMARRIVERSGEAHIGFALYPADGAVLQALRRWLFPTQVLLSLALSAGLTLCSGRFWLLPLYALLDYAVCQVPVQLCLFRFLPAREVFGLELAQGIPPQGRTLLVKTVLLTGDGEEELDRLEQIYLANRDCGGELSLGLLADLPEGEKPMGQAERQSLAALSARFDALNRRYDGRFFLFFRAPQFQPERGRYVPWERKRGAILELARYLRRRESGIPVYSGDRTRLRDVRFLLTLDSDTRTGVETVRPLVGAMLHPLNRPVVEGKTRRVVRGYGLLQPQIRVDLTSAGQTWFARLFAGCAGSEPYRGGAAEWRHDLYDSATFSGKGILDIDAYLKCLDGRLPEGTVLSHDFLEGEYLHCGFCGGVSFTDAFPGSVASYYRRQHRWMRGDWQNLPWLAPKRQLGGESRRKLAGNLRRSLTPIAVLSALLLWAWTGDALLGAAALLCLFLEGALRVVLGFFRPGNRRFHARMLPEQGRIALAALVQLLLLPVEAFVNASAIVLALWRSFVSHKNRLQWSVAGSAHRASSDFLLTAVPGWACGLGLVLFRDFRWWPLAAAWLAVPLVVLRLDRRREGLRLNREERGWLRHEAEQIYGFFADHMTWERNFLPPDNVQLPGGMEVAERTSPTNIGFGLLSCLAAIDLELESRGRALERIGGCLDALEQMEKWQGNLYNWYHTRTLAPMEPQVVSSVDSGNLCA
ncbi:MAG: hypothetical protein IJ751_09320 [Oscillospiraceae bacterium]|nr:hypothetical protein [Oscillospiraceae bacterium]